MRARCVRARAVHSGTLLERALYRLQGKGRHSVFQILVPTDFSLCSATAVHVATSFSQAFGSRIDILHVLEPKLPIRSQQIERKFRKFLRAIPAEVLDRVRMKLSAGDLVERLVETANDGYDFVLIGGAVDDDGRADEICRMLSPRVGCPVFRVSEPELLAFDLMETLLHRLRGAQNVDPPGRGLSGSKSGIFNDPSKPARAFL